MLRRYLENQVIHLTSEIVWIEINRATKTHTEGFNEPSALPRVSFEVFFMITSLFQSLLTSGVYF